MDIFALFLSSVFFCVKVLTWPCFKLCNFRTKKVCPAPKNPLLFYTATKLASMIRTKQVTSEEIVQVYISRIQEVNPLLNAVVEDRFENALLEAKNIDKFLSVTEKTEEELKNEKPLLGVPITVKESISVAGMSNAAGAFYNEIPRARTDAEIVQLCKNSGAIPLAVTNTPELCMYWETFNNVTGTTKNPYDTRRTPAGSSGGEAALLGSGSSLISLGSDICGSLRLPALFTGVFGHKPTSEVISIQGHVPESDDEVWPKYFVLGPMTRYAEDMALIFSIITKPEMRGTLKLNEPVEIRNLKFYYMEAKTNRETILAMRDFAKYLINQYGIEAKKVDIKQLRSSSKLFSLSILNFLPIDHVHCLFYDEINKKYSVWNPIFKYLTFRSRAKFYVMIFGLVTWFSKFIKSKKGFAVKVKENLQKELENLLGDDGVLIYPTFTDVAHFHRQIITKMEDTSYASIFNILGFPATSCPMGYTSNGLPFGAQVIAAPKNDRLTIAVAQEIEKAFGGWKPPNKQ